MTDYTLAGLLAVGCAAFVGYQIGFVRGMRYLRRALFTREAPDVHP